MGVDVLEVKNVMMNSISDDSFVKPPYISMEEYDNQVFSLSGKAYEDHQHRSIHLFVFSMFSGTKDGSKDKLIKNENNTSRRRYITERTTR